MLAKLGHQEHLGHLGLLAPGTVWSLPRQHCASCFPYLPHCTPIHEEHSAGELGQGKSCSHGGRLASLCSQCPPPAGLGVGEHCAVRAGEQGAVLTDHLKKIPPLNHHSSRPGPARTPPGLPAWVGVGRGRGAAALWNLRTVTFHV